MDNITHFVHTKITISKQTCSVNYIERNTKNRALIFIYNNLSYLLEIYSKLEKQEQHGLQKNICSKYFLSYFAENGCHSKNG